MRATPNRPMPVRAAALIAAAWLLAGCAGTPLDTIWRLYGFGPEEVARLEPGAVRAAVKLPLPARPDRAGAALELAFQPDTGDRSTRRHAFPMTLVNRGRTVRAEALPSAEAGYSWYLFKLTPAAERELASVQEEFSGGASPGGSVAISVSHEIDNAVPGQELSRSVWIQLADDDDFFVLEDNRTVTIGADGRIVE